jgi:hypothetical protein
LISDRSEIEKVLKIPLKKEYHALALQRTGLDKQYFVFQTDTEQELLEWYFFSHKKQNFSRDNAIREVLKNPEKSPKSLSFRETMDVSELQHQITNFQNMAVMMDMSEPPSRGSPSGSGSGASTPNKNSQYGSLNNANELGQSSNFHSNSKDEIPSLDTLSPEKILAIGIKKFNTKPKDVLFFFFFFK